MEQVVSSEMVSGRVPASRMNEIHVRLSNPEGAIRESLHRLVARVRGARGATVSNGNGLPIASTFPDREDMLRASAIATMVARASHLALAELEEDRFQSVMLEGSGTLMVVRDVGQGVGCLILIMDPFGDVAAARLEILRTAMEVTTILDLDVG